MDEGLRGGKGQRLSFLSLSYLPVNPTTDRVAHDGAQAIS